MANITRYSYPGWGEWTKENFHYAQAVRIGDRIVCSGQGGWNPDRDDYTLDTIITVGLEEEIDQAFANCDKNLKHAGGKGLSQVYKIVTYSLDIPSQHARIVENLKKWMPNNRPIWTELGVSHLGSNQMNIEIDVEAYDA